MKIIETSKSPEVTVFVHALSVTSFAQICVTALVQRGESNSVQTFWHRLREKDIIRMFCRWLSKTAADNPIITSEKMTFYYHMTVVYTMRLHGKNSKRRRTP